MLQDRKAYEAKLDEQLQAWGAELEAFTAKAKEVSVDGMMKYDQTLDAMKKKHEEAALHLRNLKTTGDETWEQVKFGTEKAWLEVKAFFKSSSV